MCLRCISHGSPTRAAGPLPKGANLCHGTGDNGYAFLKLCQRTGDALWRGDLGFAAYLRDCMAGRPQFPTLDAFLPAAAGQWPGALT